MASFARRCFCLRVHNEAEDVQREGFKQLRVISKVLKVLLVDMWW
jgi:hypothetical protein